MKRRLTKKQKDFCKYYVQTKDAYEAAIKAGYCKATAKRKLVDGLKALHVKKYIEKLRNKKIYSLNKYIQELDKVMELAFKAENPSILIKIIEAKGKAFGFDKLTPLDLKDNNRNIIKQDLFSRIQEKTEVFKKLERSENEGDISGNDT